MANKYHAPSIVSFDGNSDAIEFLRVYETAVSSAGGGEAIMAKGLLLICNILNFESWKIFV